MLMDTLKISSLRVHFKQKSLMNFDYGKTSGLEPHGKLKVDLLKKTYRSFEQLNVTCITSCISSIIFE